MKRTNHAILAVGFALSAQSFAQHSGGTQQWDSQRAEQRRVYVSEHKRFDQLVASKKYDEAESVLSLIESYKGFPKQSKERAEVALWREDYATALKHLGTYFEGDEKTWTSVSGAQESKAWYWFLLMQSGKQKQADAIQTSLFNDALSGPSTPGKPYRPELTSTVKTAQVYMYMANYSIRTSNYYRADRYLTLAREVDPKVDIDPGFGNILKRHSELTWKTQEAYEKFPVLDHQKIRLIGKPNKAQ